jgi:ubiquinone/menaquinone biosynthesis C-methylase UbiE
VSDPAVTQKAQVRGGFDRVALDYDAVGPGQFAYFGHRLADMIGLQPGQRVLDVATGRGAILFPAIERVGTTGTVIGIDLSEGMVNATRAELAERGLTAQVRAMDAEQLDFPDASFDCVLCGFALMFFPNLTQVLAGLRRVLKPGGRVGVSTWCVPQTADLALVLAQLGLSNPAADVLRFNDPDTLARALSVAGFSAVRVQLDAATFCYRDVDEYWQNARGTLMRRPIDALDAGQTARVKAALVEHLRPRQRADGFHIESIAVLAGATR